MLPVDVDTVAVAVPDAFGRLIGKRLTYAAWQRAVSAGVLAMPEFHLITDAQNVPVSGSPVTGLQNGFRDGLLAPDRSTERRLPWDESTTIVLCDALGPDGQPAEAAPRWILRRQVERLSALGLSSGFASELEFYLYQTSYERLAETEYRSPRPAYHRAGDNDLLVDSIVEPLLGDIRRLMPQAGIPIELSQGEGGVGQFEVSLRYAPPIEMADHHSVYKLGVKTLAQRRGLAVTFMAKPETAQVGSSCHVHVSLRDESGANAVCGHDDRLTRTGSSFWPACSHTAANFACCSHRRRIPTGGCCPARGRPRPSRGVSTIAQRWYGSAEHPVIGASSSEFPEPTRTRTSLSQGFWLPALGELNRTYRRRRRQPATRRYSRARPSCRAISRKRSRGLLAQSSPWRGSDRTSAPTS